MPAAVAAAATDKAIGTMIDFERQEREERGALIVLVVSK